ncbi:MAG TPA: protein kinase [Ktedonobacteraceae bacterium]|nr:protein kinase [Ktedonobacteraceae bacterium]
MADRVGQQLGHYRLLRMLGQGASAEVYLGEHQYLERLAAIKILHVHMEPDTQEQFRREARTIAHLQHPHIVQVLDFGLDNQTPYLVMEYTPGGTLRSHHPKGTRLPFVQIVTYVNQIASALDYAHQQHVIHRDVKPENLLLNSKHQIVLSDFGLAVVHRTLDSLSTQEPAGTPLYMAPEQIQRHPCAASDQYALGIIVYEWLTGFPPFRGPLFEVFSHHLHQPPPSLRQRLSGLPIAVEEAVFKALAKDPTHRFVCIADFASALERAFSATQPLILQELAEQQAVSQNTSFVPALRVGEQTDGSFSTEPELITMPRAGRGQEAVSPITPGPALPPQPVSKGAKPSLAQSNRQRFLKRVRTFWIEGVLDHSLHGAALIALGLQEQRDALANLWHLVLQHPETASRAFPAGTRITEVYDAANGELLLLGAPGSGKTTLLLELARDLLDRAEHDEQHPMPVIFNLSSWAAKRPSLTEWIVKELIDKYSVPRKLARAWVDTDQILPLLDGLDEVAAEKRTACIESINTYRQEHGLLPLVVCSRSADYLAQTTRIRLGSAVAVQPLTRQQVDDYLASAGEPLWALRVALHQDVALHELTETPLMLSVLTLTYHDMPVEDLLRGGIAPSRQQIFERYIERMLVHRGAKAQYPPEQTRKWLTWLAKQLVQHNQAVFYIERMQPDWLPENRFRRLYRAMVGGLVYGQVSGLISGLAYGLVSGLVAKLFLLHFDLLIFVLVCMLVFTLIGGLVGGSINRDTEIKPAEVIVWSWANMWRRLAESLIIGLVGWLVFSLISLLVFTLAGSLESLSARILVFVLPYCFTGGVVGGLFNKSPSVRLNKHSFVMPRQGMLRSVCDGVLVGLAVMLGVSLLGFQVQILDLRQVSEPVRDFILGLVIGLESGFVVGSIVGLFSGLSRDKLDERYKLMPNQGIRYSAHNAVLAGLIGGLLSGLVSGLIYGLLSGLAYGLITGLVRGLIVGLIVGLVVGLVVGLLNGGIACIKHVILRWLLNYTEHIPWNYPSFLDYAAEHILLTKVGGGYIFVHRLLLEYFALLDTMPPSNKGTDRA